MKITTLVQAPLFFGNAGRFTIVLGLARNMRRQQLLELERRSDEKTVDAKYQKTMEPKKG